MVFAAADNDNISVRGGPDFHFYVLLLIGGIFLIRLAALFLSPYNLHGDEAQYWAWSKELDWGFFTKPPGIAAVIAATTSVFGDAEWAVRISSPILHSLTAYVIYRTARFMYSGATGFWAAAIYLLMPAVWLSSGIVSTDVPLLLCWALALNAWAHLRRAANWKWAVQLGLALGLGLLCKYAMLFFFPALLLAVLFDAHSRKALISPKGVLVAVLIVVCIAPNMMWNAQNDFATFSHTAANANLSEGIPFHPLALLEFIGSQFAVFGPVSLLLLALAIRAAFKNRLNPPSIMLALFVLSPLLIIALQSLLSRANANWAVTAYIAASILTAHYAVKFWPRLKKWMGYNLILQTAACLILVGIYLSPAVVNALGRANDVKRVRGWPETVQALQTVYKEGHDGQAFQALASDKRIHLYDLNYYGNQDYTLGDNMPIYMWRYKSYPAHHADLTRALPAMSGPVLMVNYEAEEYKEELAEDFERLVPLTDLDIDLGGGKRRQLKLWAGYGYTPTTSRH